MWKLAATVVLALVAGALRGPAMAHAKGPGDVIIGGADLAPYYYAIQEPQPEHLGWLGLLAAPDGGTPVPSPAPPDADKLLAASYELSFDGGITKPATRAPSARYVPPSGGRPGYLHYEDVDTGLPYGWYALGDEAVRYLDRARDTALRAKRSDRVGLEMDPIEAFVRHGRYFTGLEGSPSIISDEYIIKDSVEPMNGTGLHRVTGDAARRLLDAYIATLHRWNPADYSRALPLGGPATYEYSVTTPNGRDVFSFLTTADGSITRVLAAESFGGYFDPDPALNSLITRVVPRHATASNARTSPAPSNHKASKSNGSVAGALAAVILLTLGIGAAWAYRPGRPTPIPPHIAR
jgi:hypothetical protein